MSQNLQNFARFQKFQLDDLVDFEKCCKTHIYLQKSVPLQPETSDILPKFCQKLATTLRAHARRGPPPRPGRRARRRRRPAGRSPARPGPRRLSAYVFSNSFQTFRKSFSEHFKTIRCEISGFLESRRCWSFPGFPYKLLKFRGKINPKNHQNWCIVDQTCKNV